ncbi:thiol reductase thioredoxin [Myxococcus llanfairpwllgwyngyllgogerychwyrndrobwllllantysiliogogogochensis]|uniref:Thiol reductase thioredoxin n=1 Tax=Myxococcus llanfairpwllgwyngyllgogerychwyrndrobwllllantysiliogogogochensis TaxID=2590453 RepID=A0A540X1Y8_9BACT|nr:thioredoxin family protein [Myxococcus llanfairpwllgwyngyllgogerychwyrndrobwllllantysiliogogogochensis]TQF14684.1 thiol reductase thioredoxin [Myxococcus llanfairpwllgwyngyllgogerychwyrndrobwllllantysiliogogogochensis]
MRIHAACLLLLGLVACTAANTNTPVSTDATHAGAPLPFIEDDYARALAEAKAKGIPLFVDVWAPWCHTCRSMKAYVLSDKSLARHAGRYVWLEVNTDLTQNAAFQEKFPIEFWPTLYVIDPREEKPLLRFAGSATVAQLVKLFEDGERAYKGGITGAEALLARGDALYGEGRSAEAVETLTEALAEAPADWSRRGRAVESLMTAMYGAMQVEPCAKKALELLPGTPRSLSWANASMMGLMCALSIPDQAASKELRVALEARVVEAMGAPIIEMSGDDRSGLYEMRVGARELEKDEAGVKALAGEWLAFLEAEAAKAPNPDARSVFDSHRMLAAMKLGTPERAVPALEQSEKDLPQDYNPPARLATLYRLLGRLDDALAANDRALARVKGSRRINVLSNRVDIHVARKDIAGATKTVEDAVAYAKTLPASQVSPRMMKGLEKKLAGLQAEAQPAPK